MSQPNVFEDLQGLGDALEIRKHVDTIKDQVKYLKTAVEHAIELNKDKIPNNVNGEPILFFSILLLYSNNQSKFLFSRRQGVQRRNCRSARTDYQIEELIVDKTRTDRHVAYRFEIQ